jgi:hypothetical protein
MAVEQNLPAGTVGAETNANTGNTSRVSAIVPLQRSELKQVESEILNIRVYDREGNEQKCPPGQDYREFVASSIAPDPTTNEPNGYAGVTLANFEGFTVSYSQLPIVNGKVYGIAKGDRVIYAHMSKGQAVVAGKNALNDGEDERDNEKAGTKTLRIITDAGEQIVTYYLRPKILVLAIESKIARDTQRSIADLKVFMELKRQTLEAGIEVDDAIIKSFM